MTYTTAAIDYARVNSNLYYIPLAIVVICAGILLVMALPRKRRGYENLPVPDIETIKRGVLDG